MARPARAALWLTIPALLVPAAVLVKAQADAADPPGGATLERARAGLEAMTRRLARYACVETVDRRYYQPPRGVTAATCPQIEGARAARTTPPVLDATDRLRLEVTLDEGREIHAWPGATRFDARNVDQIIHGGPIGTGSFGAHLIGVFDNPGVTFQSVDEPASGDRRFAAYRYRVPLAASRYRIKAGTSWEPIPYSGEFWLDGSSLELQRFTIEAGELPPASGMCQVEASLDYHKVRIGDGDVLLPRQAQMQIVMADAAETASVTTFGECREYQAESEMRFDAAPETESAAAKAPVLTPITLPLGLPVTLALSAPIDTDTAAVGDPASAVIAKPVKRPGPGGAVLIPAGVAVKGRITRLEHHFFPQPYFLVAISFNRLVQGDVRSPFAARYDTDAELATRLGANLRSSGRGLGFWNVGTFLFPTAKPRYVMPAGFEAKWETLAL